MLEATGHDLYLRYTAADGSSHIRMHRVWDGLRFVASQQKAMHDDPRLKPEERQAVTTATRAEYMASIRPRN